MLKVNITYMKRFLLAIVALFSCNTVDAGNRIKTLSGSLDIIQENTKAVLESDYSTSLWDKDDLFKDYWKGEYNDVVKVCDMVFTNAFNDNSKGMKIVDNRQDAKYVIIISFKDFICKVGSFYKKNVFILATIVIKDIETEESVCVLSINKLYGKGDYVEKDALAKAQVELAKQLTIHSSNEEDGD